jgi:hypothetical protein
MAEKPSSAGQITLDQLISSTSQSVLRALQEHQSQTKGGLVINPRIWVGYWIDLVHGFENPAAGGPAGGIARGNVTGV